MNNETITYEGDDIIIEEMPQGCVISSPTLWNVYVTVSSTKDALALIASLQKMLEIQLGDKNEN